jgi:hypothetical protein
MAMTYHDYFQSKGNEITTNRYEPLYYHDNDDQATIDTPEATVPPIDDEDVMPEFIHDEKDETQ